MKTQYQRRCLELGLSLIVLALALAFLCGFPPKPKPEKIWADVCVASEKLANEYCSEHGFREYIRGQEPKEVCQFHKAPPEPEPDIRVYVGAYDLLVAEGDWRAFLRKIKGAGGRGVRIFADCQWNWEGTKPYESAAYDEATAEKIRHKNPDDPRDIQNDGGTMVLVRDSGRRFPLFDYTRPRTEYWNHLREVCEYCRELGLEVWIVMLDYCTLKVPGDAKYFSPWMCAVQRMLPGIQNGTWGEQMKPWIAAFYRQVWEVVKASGVDYLVEDMNEGDALGWDDAFMVAWFKWSNATLKALSIPQDKIVTTVGRNVDKIAPLCGFYSPHGIGRPDQVREYFGQPASKTIYSSDGYWVAPPGDCDARGRCGISEATAPAIRDKVKAVGAWAFEWLPRGCYKNNNDRADVDLFNAVVLRKLTGKEN